MTPGTFRTEPRVIVQRRAENMPIEELCQLTIGLYTAAPSPEGAGGRELCVAGYARQSVSFGPLSAHRRASLNASPVTFDAVASWPQPTHVGVFDIDGAVLAYGLLVGSAGSGGGHAATFPVTSIGLRFS